MTARHVAVKANERRDRRQTGQLLAVACALTAASLIAITAKTAADAAPKVSASTVAALPSYPVARGGPMGPLALPTIVPADAPVWEPSRGRVVVNGQPLATRTVASAVQNVPQDALSAPLPVEQADPGTSTPTTTQSRTAGRWDWWVRRAHPTPTPIETAEPVVVPEPAPTDEPEETVPTVTDPQPTEVVGVTEEPAP